MPIVHYQDLEEGAEGEYTSADYLTIGNEATDEVFKTTLDTIRYNSPPSTSSFINTRPSSTVFQFIPSDRTWHDITFDGLSRDQIALNYLSEYDEKSPTAWGYNPVNAGMYMVDFNFKSYVSSTSWTEEETINLKFYCTSTTTAAYSSRYTGDHITHATASIGVSVSLSAMLYLEPLTGGDCYRTAVQIISPNAVIPDRNWLVVSSTLCCARMFNNE